MRTQTQRAHKGLSRQREEREEVKRRPAWRAGEDSVEGREEASGREGKKARRSGETCLMSDREETAQKRTWRTILISEQSCEETEQS